MTKKLREDIYWICRSICRNKYENAKNFKDLIKCIVNRVKEYSDLFITKVDCTDEELEDTIWDILYDILSVYDQR